MLSLPTKHNNAEAYTQFAQQIAGLLEQENIGTFFDALCLLIVESGQPWCIVAIKESGGYRLHSRYGTGIPWEAVSLLDFDRVDNSPFAFYRLDYDETKVAVVVPVASHLTAALVAIGRHAVSKIRARQQQQLLQQALLERNHLLETMFEVTRDATLSTSRNRLLHIAGLRLMSHVLATQLFIAVLDAQYRWIIWSRGLSVDPTMLDEWLEQAKNLGAEIYSLSQMTQDYFRLAGMTASVPLVVRQRLVGVIGVGKTIAWRSDGHQGEFLMAYANALAVSLDQLALMERLVEQEQLERELVMARAIQQRLLPNTEILAECSSVEVATYFEPARHVSGDYYDIAIRQGKVLCVLADVSGKGIGAALIMAHLHAAFHLLVGMNASPADILREWNRLLIAHTDPGSFVTAIAIEYDPLMGSLRYCNAGHPPPLLISTNSIAELADSALVLGVEERVEYCESIALLPMGSMICMYSDGIVETRGHDGKEYGIEGLRASLSAAHGLSAAQTVAAIVEALHRHRGNNPLSDDCTLIIMRRLSA